MADIFNRDAERGVLGALIRNPSLRAEIRLEASDFSPDANRVVLNAFDSCIASGIEFSIFLLVDRLNSLGIGKLGGVVEPGVYANALTVNAPSDSGAIGLAKEIKRTSVRRELNKIGQEILALTKDDDKDKRAVDMLTEVTAAFNHRVNLLGGTDEEPVDLLGTIDDFLEEDHSFSDRAIATPFPIMNDLYGYLDAGSVYLLASRMKIGKSSFWLSMGQQLAAQDPNDELRILVLDTELEAKENKSRLLAAISGVKEFRIRQGRYKKNREELKKVQDAAAYLKPFTKRMQHSYVGGKELEEILSIARRWAFKNLTEGKRGLIVYDYFKLNATVDFKSKNSLFITLGEKMDAFKKVAKELQVPVLSFAQTNRENVDSKGGEKQQNSSVIGGSDMLAQFASNIYLLEELTPDERAALNQLKPESATHSLREIACRQRGECELGEDKLVKYRDEKNKERYCKNYLLFCFNQFNVSEVGTFRQIWERNQALGIQVQPPSEPRGGLL